MVSYGRYLGKLFYPDGLCAFYPHPGWWPAGFVLAAALLLAGVSLSQCVRAVAAPFFSPVGFGSSERWPR